MLKSKIDHNTSVFEPVPQMLRNFSFLASFSYTNLQVNRTEPSQVIAEKAFQSVIQKIINNETWYCKSLCSRGRAKGDPLCGEGANKLESLPGLWPRSC